jgi:chaperonin cofactor prefoldin
MTDEQIVKLVEDTKTELYERLEKVETTLLKEFRKWAVRFDAKVRIADASITGFNERLEVLEERVDSLEDKEAS